MVFCFCLGQLVQYLGQGEEDRANILVITEHMGKVCRQSK